MLKFFGSLPDRWEFHSPDWIKINIDGAARGYLGLSTHGGIFCGSLGEFIGVFYAFLKVQTTLVVEFYGVIHTMEEAQKMGLTNVRLECDLF